MLGINASYGGSGVTGTVIIYHGKLHENGRKRLAVCRKDDQPVLAINMDLFKRNRKTLSRHIISWSTNHQIGKLSFCSQKHNQVKKPSSESFWLKNAKRCCLRGLALVYGMGQE